MPYRIEVTNLDSQTRAILYFKNIPTKEIVLQELKKESLFLEEEHSRRAMEKIMHGIDRINMSLLLADMAEHGIDNGITSARLNTGFVHIFAERFYFREDTN